MLHSIQENALVFIFL